MSLYISKHIFSFHFFFCFNCFTFHSISRYSNKSRLRNWTDLLQTSNLVIKDLFSKSQSQQPNNTNQKGGQNRHFLPIGLAELLLLTSQAHQALGHVDESTRCLKLAVISAERKFKQYGWDASDTVKSREVCNYWKLHDILTTNREVDDTSIFQSVNLISNLYK